jgi:hypothetical protein
LADLQVPANDTLFVAAGPGNYLRRKANSVTTGEYVWAFIADSFTPTVAGHFQFVRVTGSPAKSAHKAFNFRWFNHSDGPQVTIPRDWAVLEQMNFRKVSETERLVAFSHPGTLHDVLPLAVDLELFSNGFKSPTLTEEAAYFLGAFALRPQMYVVGKDTWGLFGTRLNRAGDYGISKAALLRTWLKDHRAALEVLADKVWGKAGYLVEQRGQYVGLPDQIVTPPHLPDRGMAGGMIAAGVVLHAPIAAGVKLSSQGLPKDPDLRTAQYWYSCFKSHLLERTTTSVQKAFLLGALDTVSNADKDRRSIGLDWPNNYVGEFPFYSAVHEVGRSLLSSFEGEETGNPRVTPSRTRGRLARCRITEAMLEVGFISELRTLRAKDYEPDIGTLPFATFPTPNVLSVILGTNVSSIANSAGFGSSERDLTEHKLFRVGNASPIEMIELPVAEDSAFAVCSLPLGTFKPAAVVKKVLTGATELHLVSSTWRQEALDKIARIGSFLPKSAVVTPDDMLFEYLIAILASSFDGCTDAWVVPRSEDEGVDVGATFSLGSDLGHVNAIFQAKLQRQPVGRRIVDMIRGSLFRENAALGYVVTNKGFTVPAKRSAEKDHPEIRLIDGEQLVNLLLDRQIGLHVKGKGLRRKVYLDLSFFEKLRSVAEKRKGKTGKIRLHVNAYGNPDFRT